MTVFTIAALAAMIANPACGNVADDELAAHLQAAVVEEFAGDAYAIGVNADPARGLPKSRTSATTAGEAIDKATALIAQGRSIDLGLSQINVRNLERHRLTLATAFDECANLRAGAEHLAADHAWVLAHRRYNCGSTDCGIAYAQSVTAKIQPVDIAALRLVRRVAAQKLPADPAPVAPELASPFTRPGRAARDVVFSSKGEQ